MSDKGIIFSAPMVRALLAGRKTQTRRLCAWANNPNSHQLTYIVACDEPGWFGDEEGEVQFRTFCAPGDRLYVREANELHDENGSDVRRHVADGTKLQWSNRAQAAWIEEYSRKHCPSIHMPRWASRLWLAVTDVRVRRLQEISEEDCIAEGPKVKGWMEGLGRPLDGWMVETEHAHVSATPRCWYRELWDSLHTKIGERWDDNPWVTAVTFEVHHGNIDQVSA